MYAVCYPCHGIKPDCPSLGETSSTSLGESLSSFINYVNPASPVVEAITKLHNNLCRNGII